MKKPKKVSPQEAFYLNLLQNAFQVQYADGKWGNYTLEPHQVKWHLWDMPLKKHESVTRIVVKSRNTSFTVSGVISTLAAIYWYRDRNIPVGRLSQMKVRELIDEIKKIIKKIKPIRMANGSLFPFDPSKVKMTNADVIHIQDRGVKIIGYPCLSKDASENIRSNRCVTGMLDETNFMRYFVDVWTALRDATAGSINGKVFFGPILGTTLKGETTNFYKWFKNLKKLIKEGLTGFKIFEWPVFDLTQLDIDAAEKARRTPKINYFAIKNLIPIVKWHDIKSLWEKFVEDPLKFYEEYLAMVTPDDAIFYELDKIDQYMDEDMINISLENPPEDVLQRVFYGACDPAEQGKDLMAVSIWEEVRELDGKIHKYQRCLFYEKKTDLDELQDRLEKGIDAWKFRRFRIDGNGLGVHMSQYLFKKSPDIVEVMRGAQRVKLRDGTVVPLKEWKHTYHKKCISEGTVHFINDDIQYVSYGGVSYRYDYERDADIGHCDIVEANVLACLPVNWEIGGDGSNALLSGTVEDSLEPINIMEEVIKYNSADNMMNRLADFKRKAKRRR